MKKNLDISRVFILGGIAILLAIVSCSQTPEVSISDRLRSFINDINARNYSSLKEHTHSSAAQYNQADATFWKGFFPEGENYTSSNYSPAGDTVNTTITSTTTYSSGTSFVFTFKESDPKIWKILKIVRVSTTIFS